MPRVKRGTVRRAKRKKLARLTKGYFLTKSKLYRSMKEAADRAGQFAYRDRKRRKRDFRRLWITRIGAAARLNQLTYSQFMFGLKKLGILLDRKMLSEMAARDSGGFTELAGKVREAIKGEPSRASGKKQKTEPKTKAEQ
ncbi:MAG TPA: 50S ribosomal protein L20 [Candidatus Eremiobacteraceae bacterium]|nr:50S ribosomal protein L20 [Candidatus Eremiobacteraceae bacterium]